MFATHHTQPICAESVFEYTSKGNLMNKSIFVMYISLMHMMHTYEPLFVFFSGECALVRYVSRRTDREWIGKNKKSRYVCSQY